MATIHFLSMPNRLEIFSVLAAGTGIPERSETNLSHSRGGISSMSLLHWKIIAPSAFEKKYGIFESHSSDSAWWEPECGTYWKPNVRNFAASLRPKLKSPASVSAMWEKERGTSAPRSLLTNHAASLLEDDSIDVVLELMGGRYEAATLIERALESRKNVITANKLVLAHELPRLAALAERQGVELLYSASVCGSVPVLAALDELRTRDTIRQIKESLMVPQILFSR